MFDIKCFPLITVGITCFNASDTIERAIVSALSQKWPNLEVLIVDDGSGDASIEIIKKFSESDGRIRVIEHPSNFGCAFARNTLINSAKGDFLAFFDDDDVSRADRLPLQYAKILSYENSTGERLVACYASGERVYPNGYAPQFRAVGIGDSPPVGSVMADYLLFNSRTPGVFYGTGTPTCSMMARTVVFRELDGFDTAMRRQEDVEFAVRLAFKGGHFVGISEPVITQYVTGGSEKSARLELDCYLYLLDKYSDYLKEKKIYYYIRLWARMKYRHFAGEDMRSFFLLLLLFFIYPFRTIKHLKLTGFSRLIHEWRMRSKIDV